MEVLGDRAKGEALPSVDKCFIGERAAPLHVDVGFYMLPSLIELIQTQKLRLTGSLIEKTDLF